MSENKTKSTPVEELTYEVAAAEIETILEAVEGGELPIGELAPRVERAAALLQHCRRVLRETELRVTEAVATLEADHEEGT